MTSSSSSEAGSRRALCGSPESGTLRAAGRRPPFWEGAIGVPPGSSQLSCAVVRKSAVPLAQRVLLPSALGVVAAIAWALRADGSQLKEPLEYALVVGALYGPGVVVVACLLRSRVWFVAGCLIAAGIVCGTLVPAMQSDEPDAGVGIVFGGVVLLMLSVGMAVLDASRSATR